MYSEEVNPIGGKSCGLLMYFEELLQTRAHHGLNKRGFCTAAKFLDIPTPEYFNSLRMGPSNATKGHPWLKERRFVI